MTSTEQPSTISNNISSNSSSSPSSNNNTDDASLELLFKKLDINNDHFIDKEELEKGIRELQLPSANVNGAFDQMDFNHDQRITFEEFSNYVRKRRSELRVIFSDLDKNGDGFLDMDEVSRGVSQVFQKSTDTNANYPLAPQVVKQLMKRIDANGDGVISFEEWCNLLTLVPDVNIASIVEYWRDASSLIRDDVDLIIMDKSIRENTNNFSYLNNTSKALIAGALSGAISKTVTAPLERLKILYQVQTRKPPSILVGFKEMYMESGIKGLFRGNGVNILKSAPEKAIKFAVFERVKKILSDMNGGHGSNWQTFIAGSASGVTCHTALYPLEVVKTRLSVAPADEYKGIMDAIKTIAQHEGYVVPFFRGLTPSILGTIWSSGFSLMSYEWIRATVFGNNPSVTGLMFCGSASSLLSQIIFYPLHVLNTRMITQGAHQLKVTTKTVQQDLHGQVKTAKVYNGMIDACVKIVQKEGYSAMFKGFIPSLIKGIPAHAVSFAVYEQTKRTLGFKEIKSKHH
ncbi:predicted protein [Naegleria gruberi]|uniref:Predicted protein n=1 Tax=Naegleria gruberi TaxID=5762 RepID=D2VKK4_NAEGR|nr:uncharacterized protein NAEGRDRAFT_80319 [Naegleria gruberi]EFC42705.1 predicted protein [Naegleria gruberi]|eukprot:XP_002675449.1 predicted protein [Naegleria gruberi strain NEG-M]